MKSPSPEPARVIALLPAWNAADFITPVLRSLAAQTHPDFRVIISDDASTDGTAALCEAFAAGDARFEVIRQPSNLGWIGNVNALLAAARGRGDYFFFAFHDDLVEPEYAATLADALDRNPAAVIAFCDVRLVQSDGTETIETYPWLEGVKDPFARGRLLVRKQGHWWIPNRGLFRAWAADRIGGLKRHAAGEFVADWPWLLHMSLLGEEVRVPRVLCTKHFRRGSISRNWNYSVRTWWAVARSCAREVHASPLGLAGRLVLWAGLADFALRIVWRRARVVLQDWRLRDRSAR